MRNSAQAQETLLDSVGLARRLHVGVGTVNDLRRAGRIPFLRIGPKTIRFDISAVVDALRGQEGRAQSALTDDRTLANTTAAVNPQGAA